MTRPNSFDVSSTTKEAISVGQPHHNAHGIAVWATGLLLTGELAGAGMVALPQAIRYLDWIPGLISLVIFAFVCGYMGMVLGECWNILQERWPEYRDHCKRPYQEIGRRSIGPWMTHVISISIDFTLFGTCVSYLILAAQNIRDLLITWSNSHFNWSFCIFLVILAVCLLPLTFLGSPKDFWQVVVLAMICTTIAFVAIIIGIVKDIKQPLEHLNMSDTVTADGMLETTQSASEDNGPTPAEQFDLFFLAFGIVLFAYTGHSAFPTIQQDMKQPTKWNYAIVMAFALQLVYYIPISCLGYYAYGVDVNADIIVNIKTDWCREIASLLITFHVLFSFVLMINPVSQEFEHLFNVPFKFCWQRVVVRSCLMVAIVFVAETIPNFGVLLSLIGGTGSSLLCLVYPPIMYYMLIKHKPIGRTASSFVTTSNKIEPSSEPISSPESKFVLPWYISTLFIIFVVIGLFTAVANAYSSIKAMVDPDKGEAFVAPCYINPWPDIG